MKKPRPTVFRTGVLLLAGALLLGSHGVAFGAASIQGLDSIREAARQFLQREVEQRHGSTAEIRVGQLDRRLRLQRCATPLEVFPTGHRRLVGATTVGVRCAGPKPWTLYVSARVTVYDEVLVAARPLSRGHRLGEGDVHLARRALSQLHYGYLERLEDVRGMVLTRRVARGEVLRSNQLQAPKLVRRGEKVTLTAQLEGVEVRMQGKALSDGAAGQRIQVRNLSSRRVVEGTVVARGVVRVAL